MVRRRKYRRRKKTALDYIALPRIELDPDTKRGIFIVFILVAGVVSLLSLFGLAGSLGVYLARGLVLLLGWGRWLAPVILLVWGWFLYNDDKYHIRGINYFGLFLFIISFQALLHFFIEFDLWRQMVSEGVGGGYIGFYSALAFYNVLGFWGSLIVLVGLLFVALMLLFEIPLSRIIGRESLAGVIFYPVRKFFAWIFSRREGAEEEEEEEEFEDEEEEEEELGEDEGEEEIDVHFEKKEVGEEPEPVAPSGGGQAGAGEEPVWRASHIKIDLPLNLLNGKISKPTSGDIKNNALIIQRTLENFGIAVTMGEVSVGPTVTQYTFKPAEGIKLARITTLSNDLALALAAHPIRIEAPIPGRSLVGVEVPNQTKAIVWLREILDSREFKQRKTNLMISIGKDVSGQVWMYDLNKMPHLLVAGATGSGKSVCLNSIIVSLLYQNNPDDLRFILVDPKRVELPVYNGIPHLLTPVITNVSKTINALKWCLNEMDRRFETLSRCGQRNIQTYNAGAKVKMPYIIFVIDELADLMVAAARDIEAGVIRLAQMARAVGIHLVLATQRPSVDVITGLIKANMPARIAFSVASGVDSKTILDSLGAEKLLGQGDMLFITAEISKPKRLQAAFVSDREIKRIVNYIKAKAGEPDYIEGITDRQKVQGIAGVGLDGSGADEDDLFEEAKEIIVNMGKASASLLQRRLSIGYARAARLLDILEEAGIVGPANGAKPREILISQEQYAAGKALGTSGVSLHKREETEEPEEYLEAEGSEIPPIFSDIDEQEESEEPTEDDYEEETEDEEEELAEAEEEKDEAEKKEEEELKDGEEEEVEKEDEEEGNKNEEDEEDEGRYFSR